MQVVGKMDLIKLQWYTISEKKSGKYIKTQGSLERFDKYPYCECNRIGWIWRGKYKCYGCSKK